jgi:hypothetical protein
VNFHKNFFEDDDSDEFWICAKMEPFFSERTVP